MTGDLGRRHPRLRSDLDLGLGRLDRDLENAERAIEIRDDLLDLRALRGIAILRVEVALIGVRRLRVALELEQRRSDVEQDLAAREPRVRGLEHGQRTEVILGGEQLQPGLQQRLGIALPRLRGLGVRGGRSEYARQDNRRCAPHQRSVSSRSPPGLSGFVGLTGLAGFVGLLGEPVGFVGLVGFVGFVGFVGVTTGPVGVGVAVGVAIAGSTFGVGSGIGSGVAVGVGVGSGGGVGVGSGVGVVIGGVAGLMPGSLPDSLGPDSIANTAMPSPIATTNAPPIITPRRERGAGGNVWLAAPDSVVGFGSTGGAVGTGVGQPGALGRTSVAPNAACRG